MDEDSVSVWFICKSCGYTFHFQTVSQFLEHKKRVHHSEFEKMRCIVFKEKDNDEEHYTDQNPEMYSNLFHVDKVDLPEGEVECFVEPETKLSATISTNAIVSQDSPDGNELLQDSQHHADANEVVDSNSFYTPTDNADLPQEVACFVEPVPITSNRSITSSIISHHSSEEHECTLVDPKLLSSYVLVRRLASVESQLVSKENEMNSSPILECLNSTSMQHTSTILPLQNGQDGPSTGSTSPIQKFNDVHSDLSDLNSASFKDSTRVVSFCTDATEENTITMEIIETEHHIAQSHHSPHDSSIFQSQFVSCSPGSEIGELDESATSNILSPRGTLTQELDECTEFDFDASSISSNSVLNEFENPAEIEVIEEIIMDFKAIVPGDDVNVNLKPKAADLNEVPTSNENCGIEKSGSNKNVVSKYNPYVLVKRLKFNQRHANTLVKETHYENNDSDYQPCDPQDSSSGSDSDFDAKPRTRIQHAKRDPLRPIREHYMSKEFVFPLPKNDSKDGSYPLPLKDWLLEQRETTSTGNDITKNVILLDPDPTVESVGPITSENPISCKLCGYKLTIESKVKFHAKYCWLHNKQRHRYCIKCERSFPSPADYRKHKLKVHGTVEEKSGYLTNRYKCEQCARRFSSQVAWKYHTDAHKENPQLSLAFQCEYCSKSFYSQANLVIHRRIHSDQWPFKCEEANCSKAFRWVHHLKRHAKAHTMSPFELAMLESSVEENTVVDLTTLTDWLKKQVETANALDAGTADAKNVILLDPDPTKENIGPVTSENPISCKLCCEKLTSEYKVKLHVSHCWLLNKTKHRYCVPCRKGFNRIHFLNSHRQQIHRCSEEENEKLKKIKFQKIPISECLKTLSDRRPYHCQHPGCSKSFKSSHSAKIHSREHEGKRYECTEGDCCKYFLTPWSLKNHIKEKHTEEGMKKNFECDICLKKFFRKDLLNRHAGVHLSFQDKPFKCPHEGCKEAFHVKRILEEHERKHTGEQPFVCDTCGKSYTKEWSLKKHMRFHENSHNKHACHICPRKFPGTWELKQHLLIHEKGKQFVCQHCGRKCMTKANLDLHEKTHSPGKECKAKNKNKNVKKRKAGTSSQSGAHNESSSEGEESIEASTESDEES